MASASKKPRVARSLDGLIDDAMPESEMWARIAAVARGEVIVPRVKIAGQVMERDPIVPRISDVVHCLELLAAYRRGKPTQTLKIDTPEEVRALSDGELRARAEAILVRLGPVVEGECRELDPEPARLPAAD